MTTSQSTVLTGTLEPQESLVTLTHIVYALHAASIVIGLAGAATVIGSFLGGIPSIIAVVLNYLNRSRTLGTYLESHFRWQIRTFWYALLWAALSVLAMVTVILIPVSIAALFLLSAWVIYRVVRGWLRLRDHRPMYQ